MATTRRTLRSVLLRTLPRVGESTSGPLGKILRELHCGLVNSKHKLPAACDVTPARAARR